MKSGITKKVVAFAISLAMLTGSIPANAEGTVSGMNLNVETLGNEDSSDVDVNLDQDEDENTGNTGSTGNTGNSDENGDPVEIVDPATPLAPAPGTDGSGSGSSTSNNAVNTEKETTPTTSGNSATPTISENTISGNSVSDNTVSGNTLSGNSLSGNQIEYITWSKTVDGVTITVSANKASVPEGTDLSVEQLDPVAVEVLENTIAEEEVQQNMVVKQYKAFDITLVNDGEVVQPTEEVEVTFTGDILIEDKEAGDELKVYHLDDSDTQEVKDNATGEMTEVATLNDMEGSIVGDSVVMDTPHFSTYLIALQGSGLTALASSAFVTVESVDHPATINDSSYENNKYYAQFRIYVGTALIAKETYPTISKCFKFNETDQKFKITAGTDFTINQVKYSKSETYLKGNGAELPVDTLVPNTYIKALENYKDSKKNDPKYINYFDIYLEAVQPTITASKNVSLSNWNERTYNINLNVQAEGAVSTYKQNSDIMLVFDKSGSMSFYDNFDVVSYGATEGLDPSKTYYIVKNGDTPATWYGYPLLFDQDYGWIYRNNNSYYYYYESQFDIFLLNEGAMTRMAGLRQAASTFVTSTNTNSPYSKIGIASFNGESALVSQLLQVSTNANSLENSINSGELDPEGGTLPAGGLTEAYYEIERNATNEKRFVILFSDGEPNNGTTGQEAINAKNVADNLKDNLGVTIYTICYGNNVTNQNWLKDHIATKPATGSSDTYAFTASNASQLSNIFTQISNEISGAGVTITEKVDSRFVILDESNNPITENNANAYGGVVTITGVGSASQQSITWDSLNTNILATPWTKIIKIKAKEAYIGNNNVPADIGGSGISINGSAKTGFTCTNGSNVNVKVRFDANQSTDTIFLGENLTDYMTAEKQNTIFNPALATYLSTPLFGYTPSEFSQKWIQDNNNNASIDQGEPVYDINTFAATTFPSSNTNYLMKVVFDPQDTSSSANLNSTVDSIVYSNNQPNEANESVAIGRYHVDVLTGDIRITKNFTSTNNYSSLQGDPIFTFKITNEINNKTFFRTLRFTGNDISSLSTTITGLPKGSYKVEELKTMGFEVSQLVVEVPEGDISNTYCNDSPIGNTVTFSIGSKQLINSINVFKQHAVAKVSNTKSRALGKLTHTDVVKNTFIVSKNVQGKSEATISSKIVTADNS